MATLETILAEHSFFKDFKPEYIEMLAKFAVNMNFNPGEFIARERERADHFFLIRHGEVGISINDPRRGPITIQTLGEGELFGWSWFLPPYQWHFEAQAKTLVRTIALDGPLLLSRCEDDHEFGYHFMRYFTRVIVNRLEATRLQVVNVYA